MRSEPKIFRPNNSSYKIDKPYFDNLTLNKSIVFGS